MPGARLTALYTLSATIGLGVAYSVLFNTYVDTSDPLVSSLPHPLRNHSYFANKSNIFNTWFVKQAWGWTSLAFFALYFTSPRTIKNSQRIAQYFIATAVWAAFTSWFFGPAIIERVVSYSGGECVLVLPPPIDGVSTASTLTVPTEFCLKRTRLSPLTHPELFISPFALPHQEWSARPRYLKGHDVSGHIFLLTLSVIFLADQLKPSLTLYANQRTAGTLSPLHKLAMYFAFALSALWVWMTFTTSVYWHTPFEKVSGFAIGLAGYLVTRLSEFF